MKKILFFIALLGWLASAIVHIAGITGKDLSVEHPYVMALHVGVFVVWIPMILYLKNDDDYKKFQQSGFLQRANPFSLYKILLKNAPPLLKLIAIGGFIYAFLNFMVPIAEPTIETNITRLFSGHWMAFYGIALAVSYPFKKTVVL